MSDSVTVWTFDSTDWPKNSVDDYIEETGSGEISAEVNSLARTDLEQRLQSRILSGQSAPSAAMIEISSMSGYIEQGGVREITNWVEEAGLQDPIVDAAWGGTNDSDGGIYGVPTDYGPAPWFYRQSVMDDLGIDPENISTYQELLDAGSDLPDDQYLILLTGNVWGRVWRLLYRQTGNTHITQDGTINVNSEESARVVEFMAEAVNSGVADPTSSAGSTFYNHLGDGTAASTIRGAWFEGSLNSTLPDTSGDWRVTKPPMFEWSDAQARGTVWGGSGYLIPEQIGDAEAGRMFDILNHMASEEMQVKAAEAGNFPANTKVYDSEIFSEPVDFFGGQPAREVYAEVAREAPDWRFSPDESVILESVAQGVTSVIDNGEDPQAAMQTAAERIADRTDYTL